jgi:hypothetical protein
MADLNGHEAGNGGHSQGKPTAYRDSSTRRDASRVENRRSGFSLPVAADEAFASSPQSGLAWFCFLFPLIEPDRQISRIRLSEKTHAF